jgi:hypothetical protein
MGGSCGKGAPTAAPYVADWENITANTMQGAVTVISLVQAIVVYRRLYHMYAHRDHKVKLALIPGICAFIQSIIPGVATFSRTGPGGNANVGFPAFVGTILPGPVLAAIGYPECADVPYSCLNPANADWWDIFGHMFTAFTVLMDLGGLARAFYLYEFVAVNLIVFSLRDGPSYGSMWEAKEKAGKTLDRLDLPMQTIGPPCCFFFWCGTNQFKPGKEFITKCLNRMYLVMFIMGVICFFRIVIIDHGFNKDPLDYAGLPAAATGGNLLWPDGTISGNYSHWQSMDVWFMIISIATIMTGMSAQIPLQTLMEAILADYMKDLLMWRAIAFHVLFDPGAIKGTVAVVLNNFMWQQPCFFFPAHLNIFSAFELAIVCIVTQRAFVPPFSWNPFASIEGVEDIAVSHIDTGSIEKVNAFVTAQASSEGILTEEQIKCKVCGKAYKPAEIDRSAA